MSQIQSDLVNLNEPKTPVKLKKKLVCPNAPDKRIRYARQILTTENSDLTTLMKVLEQLTVEERKELNDHMIDNGDGGIITEIIQTIRSVKEEIQRE